MTTDNFHDGNAQTVLEKLTEAGSQSLAIADELPDEAPVQIPHHFVIDSADAASWAVRKIVEARQYADRVRGWAEAELRRAEHEEKWLLRRFGTELEAWMRAELQRRGGRRRSVNLPGGTIGLRQQPQRLEVTDEAAASRWCRASLQDALRLNVEITGVAVPRLLDWVHREDPGARVRQSLLKEPLSRYVGETGELPPGTALQSAEDRFYVK